MDHNLAAFTLFTFILIAGSTARISFDSPATDLPVVQTTDVASNTIINSLPEPEVTGDSNIILPSENQKSDADVTETDKARLFGVDLTPRSDFARFHAINRHFFDEPRVPLRFVHRRPYRRFINPFTIPRSEISHGDEVVFSDDQTGHVDAEAFHRRAPSKRMKVKHDYGHHHHHRHHNHLHLHLHHANNDGSTRKHMIDREKVKNMVRQQHKEKNREHEAGFMKRIRKFLKHTFD